MSGGSLRYAPSRLCDELFGYNIDLDYGEDGRKQSKKARALNPMNDRELSELVWDVLCLLHSKEWADSGDTSDENYLDDVKHFKEKWFKRTPNARLKAYKSDLQEFANKLISELY